MKKIAIVVLLSVGVVFGVSAQGCCKHGAHAQNKEQKEQAEAKVGTADEAFQNQLAEVYEHNLKLSKALVASNTKDAAEVANEIQEVTKKVDASLLKSEEAADWKDYMNMMNESASVIANANNIDEQRKAFANFSDAIYKSIKQFGINGNEAFYQYCPMALNNEGGYWISDSKEIQNPYFGDKMLKCGTTKETL